MIEGVSIAGIATYGAVPEKLRGLSQFNFIFGSNGTGKTTISRVIANEDMFSTCSVTWKGGTKLQPMVYNHDFVEKNFKSVRRSERCFLLWVRNRWIRSPI